MASSQEDPMEQDPSVKDPLVREDHSKEEDPLTRTGDPSMRTEDHLMRTEGDHFLTHHQETWTGSLVNRDPKMTGLYQETDQDSVVVATVQKEEKEEEALDPMETRTEMSRDQ